MSADFSFVQRLVDLCGGETSFRLFRLWLQHKNDSSHELSRRCKTPHQARPETAMESYNALNAMLEQLASENLEIEIEETKEKIKIPQRALKLLAEILKATSPTAPSRP